MTIDERLDRLTQRHEALTQSHELFSHDLRDLAQIVRRSAASIDTLARIAEIREQRLDEFEGA
jgi:hypothetical protein